MSLLARRPRRLLTALALLGASAIAVPLRAQSPVLARDQILITGAGLQVTPAHQTVPRNTATVIQTAIVVPGSDGSTTDNGNGQGGGPIGSPTVSLQLPADAVVIGELRGPAFGTPVVLTTRPNEPFRIQPLAISGLYVLDNIRVVSGTTTLLPGTPDSVTLEVIDKILVSQVTTRALSAKEIQDKGIVVDQTNFQVVNFTAAFGLQDHKISIDFPMIVPNRNSAGLPPAAPAISLPSLQPAATPVPTVSLPQLQEAFQTTNVSISGLILKIDDEEIERTFQIPPFSGVVIIPGNIAYLNQFFSALVMVSNVAPGNSALAVHDVTAEIVLPTGTDTVADTGDDPLRMARTGNPPVAQAKIQPITEPGPDGKLGTADDVTRIAPQENGNAEFLIEGRSEGTHTVQFNISATLEGLPIGPVKISGRAVGVVEVRNPTFALTLSYPATITAGEEYDLLVTVTNTSTSPANFASVSLLPRSISGATLLSDPSVQIETIAAGDSQTVSFHLLSQQTGTVSATSFTSEGIPGKFELRTAVGANGIPMSPNSLVLSPAAGALPEAIRTAGVGMLGQAFALATTPATPKGLLPLTQQIVYERATNLSEAGQRLSMGDSLTSVVRDLAFDWSGSDFTRIPDRLGADEQARAQQVQQDYRAFDELFRQSRRGDAFLQTLANVLAGDVQTHGVLAFDEAWAHAATSRAPHISAITGSGTSPAPVVLDVANGSGQVLGVAGPGATAVRQIPYGAFLTLVNSDPGFNQLALVSVPENGVYTVEATGTASGTFDLGLIVPENGELRRLTYEGVPVDRGSKARVTFTVGGTNSYALSLDTNGDGVADRTITPAASELISDSGPQVVSAVQVVTGQPDLSQFGQLVGVLFSEPISKASAQDGLDPSAITHYAVEANQVLGAALQSSGRVVLLSLRDGYGPFVSRTITVTGAEDLHGHLMDPASVTIPIAPSITSDAVTINGQVKRGDGTLLPGAQLRLSQKAPVATPQGALAGLGDLASEREVTVTVKNTDAAARYAFDYVRRFNGGGYARLTAVDPETGETGDVFTQLGRAGQHLDIDIILLGTGRIVGRTLTADGLAPLAGAVVRVTSLTKYGETFGAISDASGAFSIAGVPVGNVAIEAAHVPTASKLLLAAQIPTAGATVVQDLRLLPVAQIQIQTGTVKGQVFRADGTTSAGAGIPVFTTSGGFATTDSSGSYSIAGIPVGSTSIRAIDQAQLQQASVTTTIVGGTAVTANLLLFGGTGTIVGVVRDADGTPVAGAIVGGGIALVSTSATGDFTLTDVPIGQRTVTALDQARQLTGSASVTLSVPGETARTQVILEARGAIAGRVFEADAITPVSSLKVFVLGARNLSTVTDANGGYRFDNIPVGPYTVSAFRSDFSDGNVAQTKLTFKGEVRRTDVVFQGKGRITGVVFAADGVTPLGATVGLSELQVKIGTLKPPDNFQCLGDVQVGDQTFELPKCESVGIGFTTVPLTRVINNDVTSGTFAFENVFVGPFTVQAANGFSPTVMTASGSIPQRGATATVRLQLVATSVVKGTVLRPDKTPAGKDVVVTFNSGTLNNVKVVTDEQGHFLLPLVNAGSFEVTAEDPASGFVGKTNGNVEPGQTADITIRLLGRGTVTVIVSGSNGLIPGAQVTLHGGNFPFDERHGVTNASGSLVFAGGDAVTEGPFSVSAVAPATGVSGFGSGSISSPDGHADVALSLPDEAGTIHGRFLRTDNVTGVPNAQVRLSSSRGEAFATTAADGSFSFTGVAKGGVTVEGFDAVTARRGRTSGEIVANLQDLPLDIVEVPQGSVKGVVRLSKDNSAVAGASVTISVSSVFGAQFSTTSAADGSFRFPAVSKGNFTVQATDPSTGIAGSTPGSLDAEGDDVSVDVLLQVPAVGRVEGFVRTATGAPALAAQVVLNGGPTTTVDNNGFYVFDSVPKGSVSLVAIAGIGPDGQIARGEVAFDGDVEPIDLQFIGTGTVTGTVTKAGAPVAFAQVTLTSHNAINKSFGAQTQTDSSGHFEVSPFLVGEVYASATETTTQLAGGASGTLAANGAQLDLAIPLQPSGAISGRVLRQDGFTPAAGMALELTDGSRRFGSTGSDGTFSFGDLALATYRLSVTDPLGEGIVTASPQLTAQGQRLTLDDLVLDEAPPQVTAITPRDGSAFVPVTQLIDVHFSEKVDPGTVNTATLLVGGPAGSLSGTWTLSGDGMDAVFHPVALFRDFSAVTVKVTTSVHDLVGKPLKQEAAAAFTTADSTPPVTTSIAPALNARDIDPSAVVRVAWSEAVDPTRFAGAAIGLSLNGVPVAGRIDFILNNTAAVFTPAAPLSANVIYQVTVRPAADIYGNVQPAGANFTFNTIDTQAPVIRQLSADRTSVIEGASVNVTADLGTTPDVAFVEFLVNGQLVLTDPSTPYALTLPVTKALAPSFTVSARATDLSGNVSSQQTITIQVVADAPPTVSIVAPADGTAVTTGSHVTVKVHATDDVGVAQVSFQATGVVTTASTISVVPSATSTDPVFDLVIPAGTTSGAIIVRAAAIDTRGNASPSVSIALGVADVSPPTVHIASPAAGALVDSGQTLAVAVTADDASGVASIVLTATGAASFSETRTISPAQPTSQATFQVPVPSTARASDHVTFTAAAVDAFGNAAVPVSLTVGIRDSVAPAPTLALNGGVTQVQPGRTISFSVSATDDGGVTTLGYETSGAFTRSGSQTVSPAQTSASGQFSVTVPATASVGSPVTLVGTAADGAGNVGRSAGVVLSVVADERPTIQMTSPATGASVFEGSTLTISANASDDVGVVRVEFRLNGAPVATFTSPPYVSQSVVLAGADGSPVVVEAIATDTAGQTARDSVTLTLRVDTTPPRLLTITPADQSVGVSIATPVQVTFSELIDPASVTPDSFRVNVAGNAVPGSFSFLDGNATASFAPSQLLPLDSVVVVELTAAITDRFGNALVDAVGNPLTQPLTFRFATGVFAMTSPPPNSDVVEKSRLVLEAHGSSSLGIARVVFTVNGVDVPATGGPTFTATFDVPAASTTPILTIVAIARDGGGSQIATAQNVVNVTVGLQASPAIVGVPLGGSAIVRLMLSSALVEDLPVSFEAVDPTVVTLPSAPVIVRAGQTMATATIGGAAVGNTTVLAHSSHGMAAVIASVSIPDAQQTLTPVASATGISIPRAPIAAEVIGPPASQVLVTVKVTTAPVGAATPLSATSSDSSIAHVVGTPVVQSGQQVASLTIATGTPGVATLTVRVGNEVRSILVVVGDVPASQMIASLAPPVGVAVAQPPSAGQFFTSTSARKTLTIRVLSTPAAVDTPVVVTSSNSAVATVDGQPIVRAGQEVATITVVTGEAGTATLVFKAGAEARELTVAVGASPNTPVPAVLAAPAGVAIAAAPSVGGVITAMGSQQTFGVRLLSQPAAADTPVVASTSDPLVASVAAGGVVLAGQQVAQITIATGTAGVVTVTLRAGNEVRELTVVVGGSGNGQTPAVLAAPVGVAITPAPLAGVVMSPIGAVAIVGVRLLSAAATSDVLVTVTSSDTNVATVQGSVFVHAGEQVAQIGILTTTQGAAVLTLKAGDQTVRFTVITGTPPAGSVPIIIAPIVGVRIQQ